ncbi:phage holin family protein [Nocardioides sp.]|uniref:phage holin family protein n=1 Tax=Nocardioides sp. TaxID=35761 RepID=UPI003D10464A
MRFVTWLLTNAAAIAVAAWLLNGITLEGTDWQDKIVPLLLVALILGLVTMFVEPVVKLLSLPFIILTIGLFLFVINALMLWLTSAIADGLDIGFQVDGFWAALWGSIIITLVTGFIDIAVLEDR